MDSPFESRYILPAAAADRQHMAYRLADRSDNCSKDSLIDSFFSLLKEIVKTFGQAKICPEKRKSN
jgi:hypothetical protein